METRRIDLEDLGFRDLECNQQSVFMKLMLVGVCVKIVKVVL